LHPVFLSYRQLDDAQRLRVRDFAERLRACGITVILDQFFMDDHPGGPADGWPKWSSDQAIHTERVLIIGSESWFQCFDGKQTPGTGLGAACEAGDLRQRIYKSGGVNEDIRVVLFEKSDRAHVSFHLEKYHHFHAADDFAAIVKWLDGIIATTAPIAEWPIAAPALHWPVADHTDAREAFAKLITRGSAFRYLPISGASEMGKSHLTNQFLANAHSIDGLRCARFDFKGSADMDMPLATFATHLEVPAPKPGTGVTAQLAEIFAALKAKARPTLLIFDTFELAGDADRWVKDTLLLGLSRLPWMRVIIVGQKVPPGFGQPWAAVTAPLAPLTAPTVKEWFDFGQEHGTPLTIEEVQTIHKHARGRIALLAQFLGPAA
jgi:hypothetical protein